MNLETVRTLRIQAKAEGFPESTAAVNGLSAAHDNLAKSAQVTATVTDAASKKQLSVAQAYQRQTLALDEQARMQVKAASASKIADQALAQGIITQGQYAARIDLINEKHGQGSVTAAAFSKAIDPIGKQLIAMSSGAGPVGVFLSALGPWGLGAAIGIGAAANAFDFFLGIAEKTGRSAQELRNLRISTGFTITEIGALKHAAADLAIEGDKVQTWLERMGRALVDARNGTGPLADSLHAINPELLLQLEATKTNAEGYDVLAKAAQNAGVSLQKFLTEIGGRGSSQLGLLFNATQQAGGLSEMLEKAREFAGVSEETKRHWADVQTQIDEANKHIGSLWSQAFPGLLDEQLKVVKAQSPWSSRWST